MDKFLPLGTRVPKKNTNEDGDEDEEPEMGRRSRSTDQPVIQIYNNFPQS